MKKEPSKKEIGNEFHDYMLELFTDSGFKILKSSYTESGPDIIIGYNKIKIIVQCKCSGKKDSTFSSLQSLIDEYSKKVEKYNADCAILAISGYKIPENFLKKRDKILKRDKVAIWDDIVIDHYEELVKRIEKYTVFQVLGDINITKPFAKAEPFTAFKVKQGKFKFYSTAIPPKFLLNNCYVLRRVFKGEAYQRLLNKKRVKEDIPTFINNKDYLFPNSIILVSRYPLDYTNNSIYLKNKYASLWVIDGQHRLYSFCNIVDKKKLEEFPLLCTIFDGTELTTSQEGKIFIDINSNAKTVSTALILELYPILGIKDRKVEVGNRLRNKKLFENSIKTYSDKKGSINFTTFCTNQAMRELTQDTGILLKDLYEKYKNDINKYETKAEDKCFNILYDYFSLIKKKFKYEWEHPKVYILKTDKGIRTLMRLLLYLLNHTNGKWNKQKFDKMLKCLKDIKYLMSTKRLKGLYAGEGGANLLTKEWILKIKEEFPKFAPEVIKSEVYEKEIRSENIKKGNKVIAKQFIEGCFSLFNTKRVYGILMFIDHTTFTYLKQIPKGTGSIRLIVGHVKAEEKCIKKIEEMRQEGWKIKIYRVKKKEELGGGTIFHQRWIGTSDYRINLETDLKNDGIARHKHIKTLYKVEGGESDRIKEFKENWEFYKEHEGTDIKGY